MPRKVACLSLKTLFSTSEGTVADIIIDSYPKIEQMQCSCSSGSCGERDECLNRLVFFFFLNVYQLG